MREAEKARYSRRKEGQALVSRSSPPAANILPPHCCLSLIPKASQQRIMRYYHKHRASYHLLRSIIPHTVHLILPAARYRDQVQVRFGQVHSAKYIPSSSCYFSGLVSSNETSCKCGSSAATLKLYNLSASGVNFLLRCFAVSSTRSSWFTQMLRSKGR